MCVCVRTRKRACVRLIEGMHVCADLRECMLMGWGGGCHDRVHWGRAEWSMAAAAYSDLMCTQSNKDDAASHHSRITGTSLGELGKNGAVLGFYGRPQQGLNVCGSVSHSVSPSFTSQLAVEALLEDTEEWQV